MINEFNDICFYYLLTEEEQKWDQVIESSELDFHHPRRRVKGNFHARLCWRVS